MTATAATHEPQPCFAPQNPATQTPLTASVNGKPRTRQPWKPDGDAHLIFQWVKMEGKSQRWVADALNISQPSVSRIVLRYERWQAHAKDREDGRLDPAERLRAQRWLTFERNELILGSCLRIAHEMEGFIDTSKSTIRREASSPSRDIEVRTHHATIDRTGMVARFLRLAFRINMEQLDLAELAQPPAAPPLTDEEQAEEDRQAAADAAELAAARGRVGSAHHDEPESETQVGTAHPTDAERQRDGETAGTSDVEVEQDQGESLAPSLLPSITPSPSPTSTLNLELGTWNSPEAVHNVHILHHQNPPEFAASPPAPCTCALQPRDERISFDPCITDCDPPLWPSDAGQSAAPHAPTAAAAT